VGDWLDVADYRRPEAERRAVREAVGVRDTSRCGLFDLQGPEAVRLAAALCDGTAPPAPGRVERVSGGPGRPPVVVARLGEQHVQVRVEPPDVLAVEGRLLTLLHIEHRDWDAYLASVGEAEAGIALVGPAGPKVLPAAPTSVLPGGTVGLAPEALQLRGRVWRWAGERGPIVELRVPAGEAGRAWRTVLERVTACGGLPVGNDAIDPDRTDPETAAPDAADPEEGSG
jgi:glycine cleavage system aminomethyltransferase T